jgi:hypothetical protein
MSFAVRLRWYGLELERGPTEFLRLCFAHNPAPGVQIFGILRASRGGVKADAVANAAAQQIADRCLEKPSGQIPECDFDAAGGTHRLPACCADGSAHHEHLRVEFVDIERIFAYHQRLELLQDDVFDARTPIGFTDSVDAGVGLDLT